MCWATFLNSAPNNYWQHDPTLKNYERNTVAMLLAQYSDTLPPREWYHESTMTNDQGYTVAMLIAEYMG